MKRIVSCDTEAWPAQSRVRKDEKKLLFACSGLYTTENSNCTCSDKLFDPVLPEELLKRIDLFRIANNLENKGFLNPHR